MAKRSSVITQAHLDSDLPIKTIVRGNGEVFAIAGQVVFQDGSRDLESIDRVAGRQRRYGFGAVGRNSSRSRLKVTRIALTGCECIGR
jgi:hypothetical protein